MKAHFVFHDVRTELVYITYINFSHQKVNLGSVCTTDK